MTVMPAETPRYVSSLSGAAPLTAYTFPPFEVATAQRQSYSLVTHLYQIGDDLRLDFDSSAHIWLTNDGRMDRLAFTDRYLKDHEALAEARAIGHRLDLCQEQTQSKDVRTWTASTGWRETPFQPIQKPTQRRP